MKAIGDILVGNLDELKNKRTFSTEFQVEAYDLWERMEKPKARKELPILFRLAKNNLPRFKQAKLDLYALEKDGIVIKDMFTYFLWLYKKK